MRISNNASFSDVKWEPITPTKKWMIEADPRTNLAFVFLQLRDKFLNESEIYSSGITLDLKKPEASPSPTATPKPGGEPVIMVPDKSTIIINVNGEENIKVQLFDKDNDTVPDRRVFAISSIRGIADVKPESVNSDKNGIAEFTIIGNLPGDTSIIFTTEPGLKVSLKVTVTGDVLPTPKPTAQPSPTAIPTATPPDVPDKSFTFECESEFETGIRGVSRLIMKLGEEESCLLKLTNINHDVAVDVSAILRMGAKHPVEISPLNGKTNKNGKLNINIKAIKRGRVWAAWGVPGNNRKPKFNMEAYNKGLSWGMIVDVQ